jgi:archaellum biogenesis ATPase FlaH
MLEEIIFSHLLFNEEYSRKVIPFLKNEYFQTRTNKILFELIDGYIKTYNVVPSKEALNTKLQSLDNISEDDFKSCGELITKLEADLKTSVDWLCDQTEKFCQEKAVYNAIMDSIKIIDKKDKKRGTGSIPEILTEALSVSFDTNIGHDFIEDADSRYDYYHVREEKLQFDLEYFNKITKGGLSKKTLNIILASTGVGKTMFMTHCAAHHLTLGKNVLYLTMEMSEERIAERIDANLMDVTIDDLKELPKDAYDKKMVRIKGGTKGKLIVKEYPTAAAGSAHFRHLLQELRIKKSFKPDVIYVDYLNICSSARMKMGGAVNSYMYIKAIAEELRGLAVEFDVPIISATQSNRDAYNSSDVGLDNTSESFALPATADFMFALISTEDLEGLNQILVKQLKNRYDDPSSNRKFVIGVNKAKMKFYDVEQSAQKDILDGPKTKHSDKPVMDNSSFGERYDEEQKMRFVTKKVGRKDFSGVKFS